MFEKCHVDGHEARAKLGGGNEEKDSKRAPGFGPCRGRAEGGDAHLAGLAHEALGLTAIG
jgi:hypothetical protein